MAKKFSLLIAAVAVLAMAIPALASATTVTVGGSTAPTGAVLSGTSTNTVTTTEALGSLTCGTVGIAAKLTENSGGKVAATGSGEGSTSTCKNGKKEITITDATLLELHSTSPTSGTVKLAFKADLPGGILCEFSGTVAATFTAGMSSLHISGSLAGGACGSSSITGDYALTSTGGSVVLDA